MKKIKKTSAKKISAKKSERIKKLKKIGLLDAAIMGAGTPTMGDLSPAPLRRRG